MAWYVERNDGRGWKSIGIIETNYSWANEFWLKLGKEFNTKYRLKAFYV